MIKAGKKLGAIGPHKEKRRRRKENYTMIKIVWKNVAESFV